MNKPIYIFKVLPLSLLFMLVSGFSAEFCVSTTAELNNALFESGANNQDDVIKIEQGTYVVSTTGFFVNGFEYLTAINENFDIEISGGWTDFFSNPCGQQFNDPTLTKLDGDGLKRVLFIQAKVGDVSISNLQIINGFLPDQDINGSFSNAGGLEIQLIDSATTANIERVFFINNQAFRSGAIRVIGAGRVYMKNNLIVANRVNGLNSVVTLRVSENYAINNTIMFNFGGLTTLTSFPEDKSFVTNNLIWENDAIDLIVTGVSESEAFIYNNNTESISASNVTLNESGNISQVPELGSGVLNFSPISGSALINAGKSAPIAVPIPTPFELAWHYGLFDFEGADRVINDRVDIGAFEAPISSLPDLIFTNGLE